MKNIFKKNQIIITALAIMIIIAGYLSFTNDDKLDDPALQTVNPDEAGYEEYSEVEGMEFASDIADDETTNDETIDDETIDDTNTLDDTDNDETTPVETLDDDEDAELYELGELGEASEDDILASAQDVADNGELNIDDGVPGEAVLASVTLDAGYFSSSKLNREQVRARNAAEYKAIMENPEISEEAKQIATNALIELTKIREKESATEMLLEARGFDGSIVRITDDDVEVVVNSLDLSEQQLAIIEDVVKDKTDISIENISILPVVVEE
ncbi:MAG TPA: SpoIIIAH-like family protein [Clostridiales bacterium]|nr:SpoIIIAH-like family protein [Clostridiales bacterium]